ncbi:Rab family GTPase [Legionella jordanis]|nr:ADP-ribosylation factor-like protein [Legionella jordanis]
MPETKVLFFGDTGAGKTQLLNRLTGGDFHVNSTQTMGFNVKIIMQDERGLPILDLGGANLFRPHRFIHFNKSDLAVYCINLASFHFDLERLRSDIAEWKKHANPWAELILVGTKADLYSKTTIHSNLEEIKNCIKDIIEPRECIITSAQFLEGIDELYRCLMTVVHEIAVKKSMLPIWYSMLQDFKLSLYSLPNEQAEFIRSQLDKLEINLSQNESLEEALNALQEFQLQSNSVLQVKQSAIRNAILGLCLVIAMTLIMGFIGFSIGFLAGAWSGPGAFLSGFLAGKSAAMAAVSFSCSLGLVSGLQAFRFFNKQEKTRADYFAEELKAAIITATV